MYVLICRMLAHFFTVQNIFLLSVRWRFAVHWQCIIKQELHWSKLQNITFGVGSYPRHRTAQSGHRSLELVLPWPLLSVLITLLIPGKFPFCFLALLLRVGWAIEWPPLNLLNTNQQSTESAHLHSSLNLGSTVERLSHPPRNCITSLHSIAQYFRA